MINEEKSNFKPRMFMPDGSIDHSLRPMAKEVTNAGEIEFPSFDEILERIGGAEPGEEVGAPICDLGPDGIHFWITYVYDYKEDVDEVLVGMILYCDDSWWEPATLCVQAVTADIEDDITEVSEECYERLIEGVNGMVEDIIDFMS